MHRRAAERHCPGAACYTQFLLLQLRRLLVGWFVCQQDSFESCGSIFVKFLESMHYDSKHSSSFGLEGLVDPAVY